MRDTSQNLMVAITGLLLIVAIMSLFVQEDELPGGEPPWVARNLSNTNARTAIRQCTKRGGVAAVNHHRIGKQSIFDIQCMPAGDKP